MSYAVKEIFYTLQGEGGLTGRPAVFCRFSGCNLWSGREADRAAAVCSFCDTDFVGMDGSNGGRYRDAAALAEKVAALWPKEIGCEWRGSRLPARNTCRYRPKLSRTPVGAPGAWAGSPFLVSVPGCYYWSGWPGPLG